MHTATATALVPEPAVVELPSTTGHRTLWRPALLAGLGAATAVTVIAAVASTAGVTFETEPGEAIPMAAYAQMTLLATVLGLGIARLCRRGEAPRRTFTRLTAALTGLSLVPDVLVPFDAASRVVLVVLHLVAAAIVLPAIAARLPER